jgi:uncharacterized protein YecE (DUF72 family)
MKTKVGCCGFATGMRRYFSQFELVEVQQTFYKPPRVETVLRWRRESPPDFEFALKAWQLITHPPLSPTYRRAGVSVPLQRRERYGFFRLTDEVMAAWHRTEEIAQALEAKLMVFQCPPSFEESEESVRNMRDFFGSVERGDFIFVWEPRGDWSEERVASLCQELDLVHCVDPMKGRPLYGGLRYFRLHGGPDYSHTYSDAELRQLSDMGEAYFLFNNISMYNDALRLRRLVEGR